MVMFGQTFRARLLSTWVTWMPLHAVGCVIGIFAVCALIDLLRIRFVEKPFFAFWDKHYPKWLEVFETAEAKLLHKLNIDKPE